MLQFETPLRALTPLREEVDIKSGNKQPRSKLSRYAKAGYCTAKFKRLGVLNKKPPHHQQ